MILILYICCGIAGFAAIIAFAIYSRILRERSLVSYAVIIAALALLVLADGIYAFNEYTVSLSGNTVSPKLFLIRVLLTSCAQLLFAIALPYCVTAIIRKKLPLCALILSITIGIIMSAGSALTSIYNIKALTFFDDFILLGLIGASVFAFVRYSKSIPLKLAQFIRASAFFHALAITGNLIYIIIRMGSPAPQYQFGLILYFLTWNIFNLTGMFVYLAKHPEEHVPVQSPIETSPLTDREKQIVELMCEDKSNKFIAEAFNLSENTVKNHTKSIYRKTGTKSRVALVAMFGFRGQAKVYSPLGLLNKNSPKGSYTKDSIPHNLPSSRTIKSAEER